MSQRDIDRSREVVLSFRAAAVSRRWPLTRLSFASTIRTRKDATFWIDPPWVFSRGWDEITSSDAYTEDTFHDWCKLFEPLRDTVLEHFEEGEQGAVTFIFSGDYRLFVPDHAEREKDMNYDHWYALDRRT